MSHLLLYCLLSIITVANLGANGDESLQIRGTSTGRVAFYAEMREQINYFGKKKTEYHTNVKTNIGDCFHENTNEFKCNKTGVYVFFTTLYVIKVQHVRADIMKNDESLAEVIVQRPMNYDSASNMVVTRITPKDSVTVRITEKSNTSSIVDGDIERKFTGFFLYSDE